MGTSQINGGMKQPGSLHETTYGEWETTYSISLRVHDKQINKQTNKHSL